MAYEGKIIGGGAATLPPSVRRPLSHATTGTGYAEDAQRRLASREPTAGVDAEKTVLDQRRQLEQPAGAHPASTDPTAPLRPAGATQRGARRLGALPLPGMIVGLALVTGLVLHYGWSGLADELAVAGWGLLLLAAYHFTSILADAIGWRRLLPEEERSTLSVFCWARWIGEAVNNLLPVLQVGGNVVRAQVVARRGVPGTAAAASVVVDITLEAATQVLFALLGVIALAAEAKGSQVIGPLIVGAGVMAALVGAFLVVQRVGIFGAISRGLRRIGGSERWPSLTERAEEIDSRITSLYGDRPALGSSAAWHLAGWFLGAGESWLALHLLGHPVSIVSALALEGLGSAIRGAAFAVPGALGVQEGSLVVLGGIIGLEPQTCLALSLSKRARELALGIPALIAWQLESSATASVAGGRTAD